MHLFTYGTLMFPDVWQGVARLNAASHPARCPGFAAFTVQGEVYPAMLPAAGHEVHGRVYLDLDPATLARIDLFEGDDYYRDEVEVVRLDGTILACQTYLLRSDRYHRITSQRWDRETYLRASHHQQFATQYLEPHGSPWSAATS